MTNDGMQIGPRYVHYHYLGPRVDPRPIALSSHSVGLVGKPI